METSDRIRLVDIGARGGIHDRWRRFHEFIEVRAFEPDAEECERLNGLPSSFPIDYLPYALGEKDGERARMHVCREPGSSSVLPPNLELCRRFHYGRQMEVVGEFEVILRALSTVCADFPPDVLKIDTQGTELAILKGSGNLLDQVLAVEVEVEFVHQYSGQPLFADVDIFMRSKGFVLRGLKRAYWRDKGKRSHPYGAQLVHGDALYFQEELLDCPKGHVVLAAYHQYDLLARMGSRDLVPGRPWWIRLLSAGLEPFPNHELHRFVDWIRPPGADDWHDPDFF